MKANIFLFIGNPPPPPSLCELMTEIYERERNLDDRRLDLLELIKAKASTDYIRQRCRQPWPKVEAGLCRLRSKFR